MDVKIICKEKQQNQNLILHNYNDFKTIEVSEYFEYKYKKLKHMAVTCKLEYNDW